MPPKVSIIVTTKNSEQTLPICLESIKNQTYRYIETFVIDNNSTDLTRSISQTYDVTLLEKGPERSAQRNHGAALSTSEYLLFLDSDMELSKEVVTACVKKIKNRDIIALYIPEIVAGNNFWSKVRTFERSFYNNTVIDAVRFVKQSTFKKVDGFDEALTGPEDWDLDKRLREIGSVDIIDEPLYHHEEHVSLSRYFQKKLVYSQDFEKYKDKWGREDRDIQKQFGFYYRFFGVFTENGKWKKLIWSPHLTFAMYVLRFFIGLQYLLFKK